MLLCLLLFLPVFNMGYSKESLIDIGFQSSSTLPVASLDRINDLGIQNNIRKTHRGKRSGFIKPFNNNISTNIDLSIDVRVTQRPNYTQRPSLRPDQLISTKTTQCDGFHNSRVVFRKGKQAFSGVNSSNLIPIPLVKSRSLDNSLFGLVNARSLRKNSGLLRYMVSHEKWDILAITETWIRENDPYTPSEFCPDGYTLLREDRIGQQGGGIAVLCRDDFKPRRITSQKYESFESLLISVSSAPNSLRIAVIYRPPALSCAKFIEEFTSFLENIAIGGDPILITGDFNIHMDMPSETYTKKLEELCTAFGLDQHVAFPTHIKGHTVDLVLSRQEDKLKLCDVKKGDLISDHYTVVCNLSLPSAKPAKRRITYRNIKSLNIDQFRSDIKQLPLYENFMNLTLDELIDAYQTQLSALFDTHAPVITRTTSADKRDPWINQEIFDSKRKMRQSERQFRKNPSRDNYSSFCKNRDSFRLLHNTKTQTPKLNAWKLS